LKSGRNAVRGKAVPDPCRHVVYAAAGVFMRASVLTMALLLGCGMAAYADDLESTLQNLKQAESQKDAAKVKELAASIFTMSHEALVAPEPASAVDKEMWTYNKSQATEAQTYAEYALSALSYQGPPETTVELLAMIEKQNPKSKYLDVSYDRYLYALSQTGKTAEVVPVATKAVANFPENPALLRILADSAMAHNQSANGLTYAKRLVAAVNKRPKPENLSDADWQKQKNDNLGRGYWIIGMVSSERGLYVDADRNLRLALPLIQAEGVKGPALYALGVANYQLGRQTLNKAKLLEAIKFSEQSAAIQSPVQQQAYKNAMIIKDEAAKMR
jgi:hypothetical protein